VCVCVRSRERVIRVKVVSRHLALKPLSLDEEGGEEGAVDQLEQEDSGCVEKWIRALFGKETACEKTRQPPSKRLKLLRYGSTISFFRDTTHSTQTCTVHFPLAHHAWHSRPFQRYREARERCEKPSPNSDPNGTANSQQ
jgi:hypothetical protein